MTISWALVVVGQIMLRLFLFQFNVLTTFRIELQCKFVTLKAENTPSLIVCIYMLLLWKHLKKCMFYLFYAFTSLFSLSHFFLWICVLRAWETLCFRGQRDDEAVKDSSVCLERIYVIIPLEGGSAEWSACKLVVVLLRLTAEREGSAVVKWLK